MAARVLGRAPLTLRHGSLQLQPNPLQITSTEARGLSYEPSLGQVPESTTSPSEELRQVTCAVSTARNLDPQVLGTSTQPSVDTGLKSYM